MMRKADDGRWYGTIEVLLVREVGDELEVLVGYASPFGGIMVDRPMRGCALTPGGFWESRPKGEWSVEEPHSWWEKQGFEITEPAILARIRNQSREALRKGSVE